MRILVTGGAGFIGSAVCRTLVADRGATVMALDRMGPTSSLASLAPVASSPRFCFRKADIRERDHLSALLQAFSPDAIVHAAAERDGAGRGGDEAPAVDVNLGGTWRLLEATRDYWAALPGHRRDRFRLVRASRLGAPDDSAAAGAIRSAADGMVLAWCASYGLPTIVSRAAETFGPYQFPDAALPAALVRAISGEPVGGLPASTGGSGAPGQRALTRDWLHVEEHVAAITALLETGVAGVTYEVAARTRVSASDLAVLASRLIERHRPARAGARTMAARLVAPEPQIATEPSTVDTSALERDTSWRPSLGLEAALSQTVRWYLANETWWRPLAAAKSASDGYGLLRIA